MSPNLFSSSSSSDIAYVLSYKYDAKKGRVMQYYKKEMAIIATIEKILQISTHHVWFHPLPSILFSKLKAKVERSGLKRTANEGNRKKKKTTFTNQENVN